MNARTLARVVTNVLNPFVLFTVLYAVVAFSEADPGGAALYLALELLAAATVAAYVFLMRRLKKVGDFWIGERAERLVPALVLLSAFLALLTALYVFSAPQDLLLLTLSMGLASAAVAALTLLWKASAHCAVAGHAAAAGLLLLGPPGLIFLLALPLVVWSRLVARAHSPAQASVGAAVGICLAVAFLA